MNDTPEQYAADTLLNKLEKLRIKAVIGISGKKLVVYCEKRKDIKRVPKIHCGLSVETRYGGKIKPVQK